MNTFIISHADHTIPDLADGCVNIFTGGVAEFTLHRNCRNLVVFDGRMSTLRRFQDEVEEVKSGLECGIRLADYNDYEEGDIIECYSLEKIKQTL